MEGITRATSHDKALWSARWVGKEEVKQGRLAMRELELVDTQVTHRLIDSEWFVGLYP